ncbi:hypothetical protein KDL44_09775 [bacterium]|nr:hypothetical protein [bacterium]
MSPKGHNTDLARLLDGELHDMHEVEQINTAIQADPELRSEFDEQRSIKSLLGELDEYSAPDFMATRVMGEISSRRNASRRVAGWRQALSLVGALGVVAILAVSLNNRSLPAGSANGQSMASGVAADPGKEYSDAYWTNPDFESTIEDERLRNLLQFASDAHRHSEMEHLAGSDTTNIDNLVIMVGEEGGSH